MVKRSASRAGVNIKVLRNGDNSKLLYELEMGVKLYVPDKAQQLVCISKLRDVLGRQESGTFAAIRPSLHQIVKDEDIVQVRSYARTLANELGFSASVQTRIATAVSELARNIVQYAGKGDISIVPVRKNGRRGMEVVAKDEGPGISNLREIMSGQYKSATGMGLGLMGTKVLVDEFYVDTEPGKGTKVTFKIYVRQRS